MAYAYWKSGKIDDHAVFDLFFRTNPFHGEFTIFAGLDECMKFLDSFHYSESGKYQLFQELFLFVLFLSNKNKANMYMRKFKSM